MAEVLVRWLSAMFDLRIWVGMAISGVLMFSLLSCLGLSFGTSLLQREQELAELSPDERLAAELRTLDSLGRLAGVDVSAELDQALAEQQEMLAEMERGGDPEAQLAMDEMHEEIARARRALKQPEPATQGVKRIGPRQESQPMLVPAWAIAGGFGLMIAVGGAGAAILVLRRGGEDEEPEEG